MNAGTLEQMARTDPLGFRAFPAFLMFLRPMLAAAAALAIPFASIRVVTSDARRASTILTKAALIEALVVLTLVLTETPINRTLSRMLPMFPDRHTPGALVTPGDFIVLQRAASATVVPPLVAIASAGALLAIVARRARRVSAPVAVE